MSFDPIRVAEEIQRSYAMYLIGIHPQAMRRLVARFGDAERSLEEKLGDVVRMRGPFLQALGVPEWGNADWHSFATSIEAAMAPNGLAPELVTTFSQLGFRRLYRFQEQGMQAVLDDKHTLVVAGTGRGKTESWMLPILQYVIARKRDEIRDMVAVNGTKALLIYPTKALAQDQLKRLLNYLFRLNAKLEPAAQVTVGIFDGDTPYRNEHASQAYLREAFQYFRCPIYDPSAAKCNTCGQHLSVVHNPLVHVRLDLAVPRPECRSLADLGFVRLVREDIVETQPDIVLTNPDMLNLRLLNVNGEEERQFLIAQPKFVVLDEVHTYTELFGSFTAFILRRMRQQRAEIRSRRGDTSPDPLRFIAASATVANDLDLFVRLCNLSGDDVAVVREQSVSLSAPTSAEVPGILLSDAFSDDVLDAAFCALAGQQAIEPACARLFELLDIDASDLPTLESGEDAVLEAATELVFARLTTDTDRTPGLDTLRSLHKILVERPMMPSELREFLCERFPGLVPHAVDRLVGNFALLGARSGLLESRVHMFAWPIDGFYVCLRCGHVYDTPQGSCTVCGAGFVTKVALCRECGEEALESWFCPHCRTLYPLYVTVEGETVYWRGATCPCNDKSPMLRVVWKPWYRCARCGTIRRISTAELSGVEPAHCEQCDGVLEPIVQLPWVCRECGLTYWAETAPTSCSCGRRTFALGGLLDIPSAVHCSECRGDYLPDLPHDPSHTLEPSGTFREFKLLDGALRVRRPADFQGVVPCYHRGARYSRQSRYESLMRSPANTAVTSAQFALRRVASDAQDPSLRERLRSVKMLSFSDSYSDMEQLAQDFDDPERNTFVDQAVVEALLQGEQTLKALQDRIFERLRAYGEQVQGDGQRDLQPFDWVQHFEETDIRDEVMRRFVSGYYPGMGSQAPGLVREGIVNVRLSTLGLSEDERLILRAVTRRNNQARSTLRKNLVDRVSDFGVVLERLRERTLIEVRSVGRREIVSLGPEMLICFLVDASHPITISGPRSRFISDLERDLIRGPRDGDEQLALRYGQRVDPQSPAFSYYAYRIAYTSSLLLRSEVYKGDVEKRTRRRIEHQFKFGADMHFLSSGPAMEVGIDIGDLNLLLLYGTPPNINNYLQRIGRAGRRSKRSLVLSVSKRNPIDYYYYRYPLDLITSSAQPVPLNEFNEEALRASLTWALLDFISGRYWVPWQRERTPDGTLYTDGQDFRSISEPSPLGILRLLPMVFGTPAREIAYGQPLQALSTIIHDRRDEARAYLVRLLDDHICRVCGRYVPHNATHCLDPQCNGLSISLSRKYEGLIEETLERFPSRMVDFLQDFHLDLRQKRRALSHQLEDTEDDLERRRRMDPDERREKMTEIARLEARLRAISDIRTRLDEASLVQAQQYSTQARYAYQIRAGGDAIEIIKYDRGPDGAMHAEPRPSRDMGMAIKEYHPYAVILSGREKVFTRAVAFDTFKTEELQARLEDVSLGAQPLVCPSCGMMYDSAHGSACRCGAGLVRMELQVLRRAEVQPLRMELADHPEIPAKKLYPSEVFRMGDQGARVARTYAAIDSQVIEFSPISSLEILDGVDRPVGLLEFGDLELATFADGCSVIYSDGSRAPWPQRFILCGEQDCNGVVVQSSDAWFCAMDPHHDVSRRRVVRLGYSFKTQGLRLRLHYEPWAVTHSLAHGLRVSLEKIGGLSVRNINELLDQPHRAVYVYDSVPGGAGVSELLVRMQGSKSRNFDVALEVISGLVKECECEDGCPHCLYQYGCDNWNQPTSLSRHSLWAFLMGGLHVRMAEREPDDERVSAIPASEAPLVAVPTTFVRLQEVAAAYQQVWQLICMLERQLRELIQSRYRDKFGEDWLDQVPSAIREGWQRTQEQDTRAFSQYERPAPSILDYSYLGDLLVLVNKQWQLFQGVFGSGKPAKRELQDKLEAVVKVRNPLAHNRAVPENEIKRAEVFCTDVLMQLRRVSCDRASQQ